MKGGRIYAVGNEAFVKSHGKEKALYTPRFRDVVNSRVPLSLTTDAFRVSPANPWLALSWAVTGKSVSGAIVLADDNRLTRGEALIHNWCSVVENEEHEKGKIAPGNLADFVLLSKDYFTVPEDQIKSISSVLTVVDGRVVFGSGRYANLAPGLSEPIPNWSPIRYFGGYYWDK